MSASDEGRSPRTFAIGDVVKDAHGCVFVRGIQNGWWEVGDATRKPDDFPVPPLVRLVPDDARSQS